MQVVRHYHGHLSGVYCAALHPTLDVLVTGGRDSTARVWDIRTKNQVHVLAVSPTHSAARRPRGHYLAVATGPST